MIVFSRKFVCHGLGECYLPEQVQVQSGHSSFRYRHQENGRNIKRMLVPSARFVIVLTFAKNKIIALKGFSAEKTLLCIPLYWL